jgi:hypothetical protein
MIMPKKFLFLIVIIAPFAAAASTQTADTLLPDGAALGGVDGKLIVAENACYFRTSVETTEDKFTIKADTTFKNLLRIQKTTRMQATGFGGK